MGWATGSDIAITVVEAVYANVRSKEARREIYELFFQALKQHDWDSEDDTVGIDPIWDEILKDYGFLEDDEDGDY